MRGILFASAAIASVIGIVSMLENWRSWTADQTFLPLSLRVWGWCAIAALPLLISLFNPRKTLVPVSAAIFVAIALPWCYKHWTEVVDHGTCRSPHTSTVPNLLAYVLVAAFAVFLIWWGVQQTSPALVNLGIVGFAITVGWFYFSNIFDKIGRSFGLIGLGVLFLAGGWALEKTRRRLLVRMSHSSEADEVTL
jgi:hypothetical protein